VSGEGAEEQRALVIFGYPDSGEGQRREAGDCTHEENHTYQPRPALHTKNREQMGTRARRMVGCATVEGSHRRLCAQEDADRYACCSASITAAPTRRESAVNK